MNRFNSRSAARSRQLQQQASNPAGAALNESAALFQALDHSSPGLTAAEAARRVIEAEALALRRSASYQLLVRLGPLLDQLEVVEKLG
ncbi:hypothetical protein [Aeromonas jandaei]|uniref:hypothetical protein n=1 Tax=Aeromonas jandaei TaxID=650 RepID=UPI003985AD74